MKIVKKKNLALSDDFVTLSGGALVITCYISTCQEGDLNGYKNVSNP